MTTLSTPDVHLTEADDRIAKRALADAYERIATLEAANDSLTHRAAIAEVNYVEACKTVATFERELADAQAEITHAPQRHYRRQIDSALKLGRGE